MVQKHFGKFKNWSEKKCAKSISQKKGYKMDYTIYRVTIDIAVPDYGNPTLGGRDFIDIHCDASELGFTEKRLELFEVVEDVKLNIDE